MALIRKNGKSSCVLITNGNLSSMISLRDWIDCCGEDVRAVFVTYKLPSSKGNISGILSMLKFSGFAYTYLKIWVNKIAPMLIKIRGKPASVAEYFRGTGLSVPIYLVESVNTDEVVEKIRVLRVDYIVSFSATQRFKENLLSAPLMGAINVHFGALPRYAGLSPYFWHLYNNEKDFGVTLHRIEPKLDAGAIIDQGIFSRENINTCMELNLKMSECVSPMLLKFFKGETSFEEARLQDAQDRTYFRHPSREQVKKLKESGYEIMNKSSRRDFLRAAMS